MQLSNRQDPLILAFVIVNHGQGTKFMKDAIAQGIPGGLISPAQGLLSDYFLNALGLRHDRRDLLLIVEKRRQLQSVLADLAKKYHLDKPNHGIIFVVELNQAVYRGQDYQNEANKQTAYQLLAMAVRHDQRADYIDFIQSQGVNGASYFTGRGIYEQQTQRFMGLKIPTQKDLILSVIPSDQLNEMIPALKEMCDFDAHPLRLMMTMPVFNFSKASPADQDLADETDRLLLLSIVNAELEERYVQLVKELSLNGGTSVIGHGTVSPEVARKLFNLNFNPQKKVFFTIDTADKVNQAYQTFIQDEFMGAEHQGVYLTLPIKEAYGLYQE